MDAFVVRSPPSFTHSPWRCFAILGDIPSKLLRYSCNTPAAPCDSDPHSMAVCLTISQDVKLILLASTDAIDPVAGYQCIL